MTDARRDACGISTCMLAQFAWSAAAWGLLLQLLGYASWAVVGTMVGTMCGSLACLASCGRLPPLCACQPGAASGQSMCGHGDVCLPAATSYTQSAVA